MHGFRKTCDISGVSVVAIDIWTLHLAAEIAKTLEGNDISLSSGFRL